MIVIRIGSSATEISVVTMENGVYNLRYINGDKYLGGKDFTNEMVKEFTRYHLS